MKLSSPIKSLLTLLVFLPTFAFAASHGDMGKDHKDHSDHEGTHMAKMVEKLGLDESQQMQWKNLHESHHPRMQEIRTEMKEQRKTLHEASKDGFDEAKAEAAAERLGELTTEASLMQARMHAQMDEILTDEQREKFKTYYGKGEKHDRHHNKDRKMKHHEGGGDQNKNADNHQH